MRDVMATKTVWVRVLGRREGTISSPSTDFTVIRLIQDERDGERTYLGPKVDTAVDNRFGETFNPLAAISRAWGLMAGIDSDDTRG